MSVKSKNEEKKMLEGFDFESELESDYDDEEFEDEEFEDEEEDDEDLLNLEYEDEKTF